MPWPVFGMWLLGLAALLAAPCAPASAQQAAGFVAGRDLDPRLYRAPSDGSGSLGLYGTRTPARGQLWGALALDAADDVVRLGRDPRVPAAASRADRPLIDHALSAVLGAHLGLLPHGAAGASIGVELPLLMRSGPATVIDGSYNVIRPLPLRSQGLGAPALVAKWAPLQAGGLQRRTLGIALIASAEIDTGGTLRSDPDFAVWPRAALELWPRALGGGLQLGLNVGFRLVGGPGPQLRLPSADEQLRYGDLATAGASVGVRLAGPLSLLAELEAHQIAHALGKARALAAEVRGGARLELAQSRVTLAAAAGLGDGFSEADQRLMLTVAFRLPRRDSDGDGLRDDRDHCPHAPEDFDLYRDADGCPDPDNDADGVPDARDECPAVAGSAAAFGCPRRAIGDRDGDGVDDYHDDCPDVAGAAHGCPKEPRTNRSTDG